MVSRLLRESIPSSSEDLGWPMARTSGLNFKLQIRAGVDVAIGPGKADLLGAIEREGSIAAAARSMGMSYRRAWQLVETMNRCWTEPLVKSTPGGGGRGAKVTDMGRTVLAAFRETERTVHDDIVRKFGKMLRMTAEP